MVRRIVVVFGVLALVLGTVVFNNSVNASADLIKGTVASTFDGDGNLVSCDGIRVITNNQLGKELLTCHGVGSNSTGKAVHWDFDNTGFTCGGSTDWRIIVSRSGRATLHCNIG